MSYARRGVGCYEFTDECLVSNRKYFPLSYTGYDQYFTDMRQYPGQNGVNYVKPQLKNPEALKTRWNKKGSGATESESSCGCS